MLEAPSISDFAMSALFLSLQMHKDEDMFSYPFLNGRIQCM